MDPAEEEAYWLAAKPTDERVGSPVYYRSPSSGKFHAIIHSIIPPTLHVMCEQWHEEEESGEYAKYTVVEEIPVTAKALTASVSLYNKTLAQKQAAASQHAAKQGGRAAADAEQSGTGSSSSSDRIFPYIPRPILTDH